MFLKSFKLICLSMKSHFLNPGCILSPAIIALWFFVAEKGIYHQPLEDEISGLEVVEKEALWHPDDAADKETTFKNLEEAIKILKDEQRICIELFYLQEKSYKEVSDLTGLSLLNVKSHIQNGKRNLKIILERGHGQ